MTRRIDHDAVRRLWAAGYSGKAIAAELECSTSMVYLILNDESYRRTMRTTADWRRRERERLRGQEAEQQRGTAVPTKSAATASHAARPAPPPRAQSPQGGAGATPRARRK